MLLTCLYKLVVNLNLFFSIHNCKEKIACRQLFLNSEPATTSISARATSTTQEVTTDGLSAVRDSFRQLGLSGDVTEIIMASWRSGTQKQYKTYIQKWLTFSRERNINYSSPEISEALQFLMSLYCKGLSYSAISTARSALSVVVKVQGCSTFGSHPLVIRFMKGIYENRKPKPKYDCIWDASVVIRYLSSLYPLEKLPLKDLTLKLLMLLLMVTGQLHLLNLDGMNLSKSVCSFQLLDHVKTSKPGHQSKPLVVKEYRADKRVCPITVLHEYIKRTENLRGEERQLLLSYISASQNSLQRHHFKMGETST